MTYLAFVSYLVLFSLTGIMGSPLPADLKFATASQTHRLHFFPTEGRPHGPQFIPPVNIISHASIALILSRGTHTRRNYRVRRRGSPKRVRLPDGVALQRKFCLFCFRFSDKEAVSKVDN
jgi:hypothetical protein